MFRNLIFFCLSFGVHVLALAIVQSTTQWAWWQVVIYVMALSTAAWVLSTTAQVVFNDHWFIQAIRRLDKRIFGGE